MDGQITDIRLAMLKRGFNTQFEFAAATGCHFSLVSMVLRGHRKLNQEQAKAWQEALQCDPQLLEPITK